MKLKGTSFRMGSQMLDPLSPSLNHADLIRQLLYHLYNGGSELNQLIFQKHLRWNKSSESCMEISHKFRWDFVCFHSVWLASYLPQHTLLVRQKAFLIRHAQGWCLSKLGPHFIRRWGGQCWGRFAAWSEPLFLCMERGSIISCLPFPTDGLFHPPSQRCIPQTIWELNGIPPTNTPAKSLFIFLLAQLMREK